MNSPNDSELTDPRARRNVLAALALLFLLAALLRFWRLDEIPLGFFRDEAEKGYTAFQLWHTGRQGMFAPDGVEPTALFPAFVDGGSFNYTSAIYQYLSAPFVGIFGLSVLTTRLAASLCGFLAVVATYFLSRRIESGAHTALWTGSQQSIPVREQVVTALAATMFIALSPTHILFSRWAQQGITLPLFASLGMLLLLAAASCEHRHQRACSLAGGFLMGLTFYAYDPARVVVPLILLGLWAELGRDFRQHVRIYWPAALVFFIIAIPVTHFAVTTGDSRFARISVFANQSPAAALLNAATNYLKHFDPRFLFLFGDASGRHHLPGSGLIAWGEAPFFLAGLATLRRWRRSGSRLLLFWLLAAPAAAALTNEGIPHALRSILFFPAVHLISARGMALVVRKMSARHVIMTMAGAGAIIFTATALGLFDRLAERYHDWQYGVVESLETMWLENPAGPNVLSAEVPFAPYYVLFVERTPPAEFQEQGGGAMRTLILVPGSPLPEGALVARPAPIFTRASGLDIPAPYDKGRTALYTVRDQW